MSRITDQTFYLDSVVVQPHLNSITAADGVVTKISARQLAAVKELADNYGQVVSRAKLHTILCLAEEGLRDPGALSHHIGAIRSALGDSAKNSKFIRTVRGTGYSLIIQPSSDSPEKIRARASIRGFSTAANESRPEPWLSPLEAANNAFQQGMIAVAVLTVGIVAWTITNGLLNSEVLAEREFQADSVAQNDKSQLIESQPFGIKRPRSAEIASATSKTEAARKAKVLQLTQEYWQLFADQTIAKQAKAEQLLVLGEALMCLQAWQEGTRAIEASLHVQASFDQPNEILRAKTLTKIAQGVSGANQSLDGSRQSMVLAATLMRKHQPASLALVELLSIHAGLHEFDGNFFGAENLWREALEISVENFSSSNELMNSLESKLVNNLTLQQRFNDAGVVLQRLETRMQMQPKSDFFNQVSLLERGAFLRSRQGDHSASVRLYKQAVTKLKQVYPQHHPRVLLMQGALAEAMLAEGDIDRAIEEFEFLISIVREHYPSNHLAISNLRLKLSDALLRAAQPKSAMQEIVQAQALIEAQDVLPQWLNYAATSLKGAALVEMGECGLGMRWLRKAIDQMFLDDFDDPALSSKIYARKNYYERNACRSDPVV